MRGDKARGDDEMRKIGRHKMTPARLVFRDYLDSMTLYDMIDIAAEHEELLHFLERFTADYLSRNMVEVDLKNILADELGAKEYFKRLKAYTHIS